MRKPVPGYEGLYEVDDLGNVYGIKSNKILKPNMIGNGYLQYSLCKNGKRNMILGHRIVALSFIPNPKNLPFINHKDECKTNNTVSNLEWCTKKYNLNYGTLPQRISKRVTGVENNPGGKATKKPCLQYSMDGTFVSEYKSISDAHRKTGITLSNISSCASGKRQSAGNYIWRLKEE